MIIRPRRFVVVMLAFSTASMAYMLYSFRGKAGDGDLPRNVERAVVREDDAARDVKQAVVPEFVETPNVPLQKLLTNSRPGPPSWGLWDTWVSARQIYPDVPSQSKEMRDLLQDVATRRIIAADVGNKGTQLKLFLTLEGGQQVVFKPQRYARNHVIKGTPYEGYDRHNAEVAAFHLDGLLGFHRAPPVVGRVVDLKKSILPVASQQLKDTFFNKGSEVCFYGVCLYCKKELSACVEDGIMEGSVTIWLPKRWTLQKFRHPYQRTYRHGVRALWEEDESYCHRYVLTQNLYAAGPRLLDITDAAVMDYLIGNADRHHYEAFSQDDKKGMLLLLDNGKSFGNAFHDEKSILAPITQCCRLRASTWRRVQELFYNTDQSLSSRLRDILSIDPISPVLHESHLKAIDRRLGHIIEAVEKCIRTEREAPVLRGLNMEDVAEGVM